MSSRRSEERTVLEDGVRRGGLRSFGAGALLQWIVKKPHSTKSELALRSGLGRTAVGERLEFLRESGWITVNNHSSATGGRPAATYSFNENAGSLLVADIGGSHTRVGITNLSGDLWATREADISADGGPEVLFGYVVDSFVDLLRETGAREDEVRGIGLGVPAPVKDGVIQRAHLPGWEGAVVPSYFRSRFPSLEVNVDKDANIMARGEMVHNSMRYNNCIVLKVGMGIGCGIVVDGHVLNGARGAAGDIGHLPQGGPVRCTCGEFGCLEATASGRTIGRILNQRGRSVRTSRDIVGLIRQNDREACELVRQAGRDLGGVLGVVSSLMSPSVIVVGGNLAESPEPLMAGLRETIYKDCPPSFTASLDVVPSSIGVEAGLSGAARLALETVLLPERIDPSK